MTVQHERLHALFLQRLQHDLGLSQTTTGTIDSESIGHSPCHEADMVGEELLPLLQGGRADGGRRRVRAPRVSFFFHKLPTRFSKSMIRLHSLFGFVQVIPIHLNDDRRVARCSF